MEVLKDCVLLWLLAWTLIAFALMGIDKALARRGRRRLREATLFFSALMGGSVGALLGMSLFRHKTLHRSFRLGMPAILLLQLCLGLALWGRLLLR